MRIRADNAPSRTCDIALGKVPACHMAACVSGCPKFADTEYALLLLVLGPQTQREGVHCRPAGRLLRLGPAMSLTVVIAVTVSVFLIIFMELLSAVLPIVIVLAVVPPEERHGLAELIAAADSSRRFRLWPALRVAVRARREQQRQR